MFNNTILEEENDSFFEIVLSPIQSNNSENLPRFTQSEFQLEENVGIARPTRKKKVMFSNSPQKMVFDRRQNKLVPVDEISNNSIEREATTTPA